jgi:hypothetical protein
LVIAEAAWVDLARATAGRYAANATVIGERRRPIERRFIDGWDRIDGRVLDGRLRRQVERRA